MRVQKQGDHGDGRAVRHPERERDAIDAPYVLIGDARGEVSPERASRRGCVSTLALRSVELSHRVDGGWGSQNALSLSAFHGIPKQNAAPHSAATGSGSSLALTNGRTTASLLRAVSNAPLATTGPCSFVISSSSRLA